MNNEYTSRMAWVISFTTSLINCQNANKADDKKQDDIHSKINTYAENISSKLSKSSRMQNGLPCLLRSQF